MVKPQLLRLNRRVVLEPAPTILRRQASFSISLPTLAFQERQRSTLSNIWIPTGGVSEVEGEPGHGKLIRAGFLRQAHPGVFHLLPLGERVQTKVEQLIDKHMRSVGASRVSLSSITTEDLWQRSGRLAGVASELFRFSDRKEAALMLCPTHEEEITTLVKSTLKSYKDLPLRLYQITRKYRDEIRPRHGLLRSREFIMKDLYTFDPTYESAITAYREVAAAYGRLFSELKLPILVAEASSGDMGGNYSHEYLLPNPIGEDTVASCSSCGYTANDEVAVSRQMQGQDEGSAENIQPGDACPRCDNGSLAIHRALELAHTFYLGTRYSEPFEATVTLPDNQGTKVPMHMGCFGIGVSRIVGAVAEHMSDEKGLNWPCVIAPFQVVVIPTSGVQEDTIALFDELVRQGESVTGGNSFDAVLDDRRETFGWKMRDADTTGYPVAVILGKGWKERGTCEVQCRKLGVKEFVRVEGVAEYVKGILSQL